MKKQPAKSTPVPPANQKSENFQRIYHTPNKRAILVISAFMLMLGVLGLLWAAPFPQLKWLSSYNGYINWASFFIAVLGYYYYRQSPLTGYVLILVLFAFSYVVSRLQAWQMVGGPHLSLISSLLVAVALLMALQINRRLWDKVTPLKAVAYLVYSPMWFAGKLFKKKAVK